jgi:hypothetical protein
MTVRVSSTHEIQLNTKMIENVERREVGIGVGKKSKDDRL